MPLCSREILVEADELVTTGKEALEVLRRVFAHGLEVGKAPWGAGEVPVLLGQGLAHQFSDRYVGRDECCKFANPWFRCGAKAANIEVQYTLVDDACQDAIVFLSPELPEVLLSGDEVRL